MRCLGGAWFVSAVWEGSGGGGLPRGVERIAAERSGRPVPGRRRIEEDTAFAR